MKYGKKERGAVSVFLVIILVPCLLVSSIFVDVGRVYLSKGMAQTSGELALNTLMTNYDYDLNDFYGMVASCQSIDEFYDVSAQYFLRTMKSQNLSGDEIVLLSQQFANVVGDDSIYDYLKVEEVNDTAVKAVDGADLTNATLIKNQVVDFMKYRGAIVVVEEILDKIQNEPTVNEFLESHENEPLVEEKIDFYEAEGELTKAAFKTYDYLYHHYTTDRYTNEKMQEAIDKLEAARTTYAEIHKLMITNLYNTEGLNVFKRPTVALSYTNNGNSQAYSYTSAGCNSGTKKVVDEEATQKKKEEAEKKKKEEAEKKKQEAAGSGSESESETGAASEDEEDYTVYKDVYYANGELIKSHFTNVENAINSFKAVKTDLVEEANKTVYTSGVTNDIQYWKREIDTLNHTYGDTGKSYLAVYQERAKTMIDAYAKMNATMSCPVLDNPPDGYLDRYHSLKSQVESLQSTYLTADVTNDGDGYLLLVRRLENISFNNINNINPSTVTLSSGAKLNSELSGIAGELVTIRAQMQNYVDVLTVVIEGDSSKKVVSLDKLTKLANTYKIELSEWKAEANILDTNLAGKDRDEINELSHTLADQISEEAVAELKTRLINMRSQFQGVINAIDSMTYGGKKISEITNYDTLKSQASSQVSESSIGLTNEELTSYADSTFQALFVPKAGNAIYTMNTADDYNLQLNPEAGNRGVNVPALYVYLWDKFKESNGAEADRVENEMGNAKSTTDDYLNGENSKSRYHYSNTTNITPSFSQNQVFGLVDDGIGGLGSLIGALLNGNVESIRDNLFLSVYVMEMFSYATYENEGKYDILAERGYDVTDFNKSNYVEKYRDADADWTDKSPQKAYNKSLTNKMINLNNNAAMGAEVEYILYGKSTNADNVKEAYGDIYAIRYSLNLVSAFANFWSESSSDTGTVINTVAYSLSAATGGIIPAPAIKVVILPILTLFETSNDLNRLEAGFPVELYKTDETYWHYSLDSGEGGISGIMTKLTEITTQGFQNPRGTGLFYSDYITLFVVLGFQGDKSEDMTRRMAEVIQANMQKLTNNTDYSMSNAKIYFQLEAKLKVDPLLITIPLFDQYNGGYNSSNTDWCTYQTNIIRGY